MLHFPRAPTPTNKTATTARGNIRRETTDTEAEVLMQAGPPGPTRVCVCVRVCLISHVFTRKQGNAADHRERISQTSPQTRITPLIMGFCKLVGFLSFLKSINQSMAYLVLQHKCCSSHTEYKAERLTEHKRTDTRTSKKLHQ